MFLDMRGSAMEKLSDEGGLEVAQCTCGREPRRNACESHSGVDASQ